MARIPAEEVASDSGEMGGEEATTILPPEITEGMHFKSGDVIELDVVSVDEDGSLTVKYHQKENGGEGPMEGMDRYFSEKKGEGAGSEPMD